MIVPNGLKQKTLFAAALSAAMAAIGAPVAANAQTTGTYVDVCSSGTIDSNYYNDYVEQTVCLSGDASGLDAYNEVDLQQYQENVVIQLVGADAQVYGPTGLVDSGEQQGSYVSVTAWVPSPQIGAWYTLNGLYDECQDSGADGWINCGWTGLMSGYSVSAMVISLPAPSFTISTSGTPSYTGQAVTFTATISSGADGTMNFYDNSAWIGTATISGTTATVTVSNLALGNHSITAFWPGNSNYRAAWTSAITQVVNPPPTPSLTVSTSGTPSNSGQAVTFTATISSGPQGSLTFYDQGVAIGTGTIAGTTATLTTAGLSIGAHSITATWAGDSNYSPATSSAITQTVNPPNLIYSYSLGASGYAPNGNVLSYTDSVNGAWSIPSTGGYDGLNRLSAATQNPVSGGSLSYCWSYDSFGNRTAQVVQSAPCSAPAATAAYNSNNQVTWVQNTAPLGFQYDAAGNVVADNLNNYRYDDEGRLCAVQNQFSGGITGYLYDAEGTRIAKGTLSSFDCSATMNLTNIYVLGPSNEQVSETDGQGNWKHTNIFAGGALIGTYDGPTNNTIFALTDWLGTKRVEVGVNPCATAYTSLPFGDGLAAASVSGYSQCPEDATEHHFTGKEHDDESGNDYFGARYYASSMGRFMSPDWSAQIEPVPYSKLDDPQTLNLYAYVRNNPLSAVDADGHAPPARVPTCTLSEQECANRRGEADEKQKEEQQQAQQQNQYGRQADGSYKADPAKVQKAIDGGKAIGSGQCVDLCRFLSGAPNSGSWVAGKHAADLTNADIGTAIATFDSTGHYPSNSDPLGKNSAIFMGRGAQGSIIVVDQWPVGDGPPGTHQPFKHTIINYPPDNKVHPLRSNNADAYYVIRVP